MKEEFRDIKGYEGLYQVSNLGKVKSLTRENQFYLNDIKVTRILNSHIMKFHLNHGYLRVLLSKNGKRKWFFVHRLVAEAFIPNPNNLPFINHKSEIKTENNVENLEWCNAKYNVNYGTCKKRISKANTNNPKLSTPIKCLDLETNEITYYPSIPEASRQLKILRESIRDSIYKCKKPYKKRYIFSEIKEQEN